MEADQFLEWARDRGVVINDRHSANWPRDLTPQREGARRYWVLPEDVELLRSFFSGLLDTLKGWEEIAVWPRASAWGQVCSSPETPRNQVRVITDVAEGFDGAALFPRDETGLAFSLLETTGEEGWNPDDDLFLVPDRRGIVLMLDHHDAFHARFESEDELLEYVSALGDIGIHLPTQPPDGTFKPAGWMEE